jgi:hypothetical protein
MPVGRAAEKTRHERVAQTDRVAQVLRNAILDATISQFSCYEL